MTRRGFTLVEMLVALAVAGIALAAGFAALSTLQDRTEVATAANTAALEGAAVRGMITDWLSGARAQDGALQVRFLGIPQGALPVEVPQSGRQTNALRREAERLNAQTAASFALGPAQTDEVYFPTTARTPLEVPVTSVRLFVDRDPGTPEQGLVAEFLGQRGGVATRMELVPQVTGMTIRYLSTLDVPDGPAAARAATTRASVGAVPGVAVGELRTEWRESELPRAVFIQLEGAPDDPLPPLLALPIRVALASVR